MATIPRPAWHFDTANVTKIKAYDREFAELFGGDYVRKFKVPMRQRPTCACCGQRYGSRATNQTERIISAAELPIEPYRGNAPLVEERLQSWGSLDGHPAAKLIRETWDGETYYTSYEPFCTLRCSLRFAQAAHRGGYRLKQR